MLRQPISPPSSAVSLADARQLKGRLGISTDYEEGWTDASGQASSIHAYGIANLYYDFRAHSNVRLAGVTLRNEQDALWGGLGLGGTYNWGNDKYAVYGEAMLDTSLARFGESYTLNGKVGLNVKF